MARPLRCVPNKCMVEVTLRTVHGRFLLRPSPRLKMVVAGVIGRAQRRYGMTIHALVVVSNHLHLLATPESPQQLAAFMDFVASNVARQVGRLHDWREKFWGRRYRAIVVSDEEEAQLERLVYLLSHGVKEGLVERPHQWPGLHCAALVGDGVLEGTWLDRTGFYRARRLRDHVTAREFTETERIVFSPLPCWADLDPSSRRCKVVALLRDIVERGRRRRAGRPVLGKRAILAQHPHDEPLRWDRSPAPLVHAASRAVRVMLRTAYYEFVAAFREAAHRLRCGDRLAAFPEGAFPPPLPSVLLTS